MGEAKLRAVVPKRCRGCGEPLTSDKDSEAHVIPNALGGNLKPKGIICRACNGDLDALADHALVEAFQSWPTLLDIPRDRGANPPKLVTTRDGRKVRVEADGTLTAVDVTYEVLQVDEESHKLEIAAGDIKTIRQLLRRVEKQFPQFDAKEAEKHARTGSLPEGDQLKLGFDFDPSAVFGGVATAIWLYLIHTTGRAFLDWGELLRYVGRAQRTGGQFKYFVDGLPGLVGPQVPIGHKIVARSVPRTGQLITYVEILGVLRVGGIYADAGGPAARIEHVYAYDVFGRKDRSDEFSIDAAVFERQDWRSVGIPPKEAGPLQAYFREALEDVFVKLYRERFAAEAAQANPEPPPETARRVGDGEPTQLDDGD